MRIIANIMMELITMNEHHGKVHGHGSRVFFLRELPRLTTSRSQDGAAAG